MEKYELVESKATGREMDKRDPSELRVSLQMPMKQCVRIALRRLQVEEPKISVDVDQNEKSRDDASAKETKTASGVVTLRAAGRVISKAISVAEVLKRRVPGLHQLTQISSVEDTRVFEPIEKGLKTVTDVRVSPCISIVLSTAQLDTSAPGYQAPMTAEEREMAIAFDNEAISGGRTRVKKPKVKITKPDESSPLQDEREEKDVAVEDAHDLPTGGVTLKSDGRGRGRGRGRRGRGRGGRGAPRGDALIDDVANESPKPDEVPESSDSNVKKNMSGRGRGRGNKSAPRAGASTGTPVM